MNISLRPRDHDKRMLLRWLIGGVILATATIATAVAVGTILDGDEADESARTTTGEPGGVGGAGDPPKQLIAALNSIPLPPGATLVDTVHPVGVSKGQDLRIGYRVPAATADVMTFYETALVPLGWQSEPATDTSGSKDGAKFQGLSRTFSKGNLHLTVSASTSDKDEGAQGTALNIIFQAN